MTPYWFLLSFVMSCCEAYRILVVFPMPVRSHGNLGDGVVRSLLKAGHEVTYITPFSYKNPPPNLRQIDVSIDRDHTPVNFMNVTTIMLKENEIEDHGIIYSIMLGVTKTAIENKDVQKLLNDPSEQFDAVVPEWLFNDLPAGIATVFDCPLIWLSPLEAHWLMLNIIDEPSNPAYTVDVLSPYLPPLNFIQRVSELWVQLKVQIIQYMFVDGPEIEEYNRLIAPSIIRRGRQPPSYYDVRYNASLVLENSHVSTGNAIRLPQSYKLIGGFHIDEDIEPLPEELKKIMDNAKNGVIYFSMGSSLKSKDLPVELTRSILKMFGTLKQVVLWKFEEVLPDLPPNIHILKWAPQPSILSHPNCLLFITHGGLLSTIEAVHFGVPIVGIPVRADQFNNINRIVKKGVAKIVDLSYTIGDTLKAAIQEVTTNPRYAEKAKELSFIYHDRPMKPAAELVHWVEHVVRTRGAPHLRSPASRVPFYQKMYLDLVALIAVIITVAIILLKRVCTIIFKNVRSGSQKKYN